MNSKSEPPKRIFLRWKEGIQTFIWVGSDEDPLNEGQYFVYEFKGLVAVTVKREIKEVGTDFSAFQGKGSDVK